MTYSQGSTTVAETPSEPLGISNPFKTESIDPFLYLLLVSVDAQNKDQECLQTLTTTMQYISEAGTDGIEAGTAMLEADNKKIQGTDDTTKIQQYQSQEQLDNTKVNNMNQQFSNLTQSLETGTNALNTSDQNETDFINNVLGVWDNANNLIASAG